MTEYNLNANSYLKAMRYFREVSVESQVTIPQLEILLYLGSNGYFSDSNGQNIGVISKSLGYSNSAISTNVSVLFREKLVSKTIDPNSQRERRAKLSTKGENLYQKASKLLEDKII